MMLFYKLRPLLRSAQVEKELASLHEDFNKMKEAYDRCVFSPLLCLIAARSLLRPLG